MAKQKYFAYGSIAFVAATVIGAFFMIGSPAHERARRFDERRLADLQMLQRQISDYFATKDELPAGLDELNGFQEFVVPKDPETRAPYEYSIKGAKNFQLCATFALPIDEQDAKRTGDYYYPAMPLYPGDTVQSWSHLAGHACFDVTVEEVVSPKDGYPMPAPVTVKPAS